MSHTPKIVFIDDSATMREVIKIAFRRENIEVVAYADAASALAQLELQKPDVVITDVIMPDKDGYDVCQHIKQHPRFGKTPVILMSGVVNRAVAEKAFSVKADELIRKPFQPQDLITRVKHLLTPAASAPVVESATTAAAALSSIFNSPPPAPRRPAAPAAMPASAPQAAPQYTPVTVAAAAAPQMAPQAMARTAATVVPPPNSAAVTPSPAAAQASSQDMQKLRVEVMQLQGMVKKLQSELQAEREYVRSLQEQIRFLQQG